MKEQNSFQTLLIDDKDFEEAVRKAGLAMWTASSLYPMDFSSSGKPIFVKLFKAGLSSLIKDGWELKKK